MNKKGKVLALDFGAKHVGMAATDSERMMVFPRGVISGFKSLAELSAKLTEFCINNDVRVIVFGLPMGKNGEETDQTIRFRSIGEKVNEILKMKISDIDFCYVDESFSSFEGEKMEGLASGHEKAAVKILERYLEMG